MPDALAKGTAVIVGVLLALAIAILVITSRPPAGAGQVPAEFDTAFPLVEGMHVRVDGALAGSVGDIEVNDRGNAVVNLVLNDSIEPPRADATAAVRQQDTTGDSYVAFNPGDAEEPLGEEGIVCTDHETCPRTLVSPRLDDLINAFGPAEQAGIKLILVETAKALDRRGADLNEAALALKPALSEANQALGEVASQNQALQRLISSAENVTRQTEQEDPDLERLIESLPRVLEATAAQADELDAGLEALPQTTEQAHSTLGALNRATGKAIPLAEQLRAGAPQLAQAIEMLTPFLGDAGAWIEEQQPTLELTKKLVQAARPSLEISKKRVITGAFDLTGATADLLNTVLGGEDAFPALFDDDSYGEAGGTLNRRGFGAVAVEPGDLLGYGEQHARRNWLRVSGVFNCEIFGAPVKPGCLTDVLESLRRGQRAERDDRNRAAGSKNSARRTDVNAYAPSPSAASGLPGPIELPKIPQLDLSAFAPQLGLPGLGDPADPRGGVGRGAARVLEDIVDFLFKP